MGCADNTGMGIARNRDRGAAADPLGRPLPRREDPRALTGRARHVGDIRPEGCLFAAFLRSPVARGRIAALDAAPARALAGVRLVLTAADLDRQPPLPVNPMMPAEAAPRAPWLADGDLRALGQPVALVVADSIEAARDGVEAIALEVEAEPPVLDPETAEAGPPVDPARPGNLAGVMRWAQGDVDAALAAAPVVVELALRHPRLAPAPLECRASLAEWRDGVLTLFSGQQSPHRARGQLAALLGLAPGQVRVISPDVGGAFGMKASLYPEDVLIALAARRLGRPVRWVAGRGEDLLSASHGRGALSRGRMGFDAQGRILALEACFLFPLGYWTPFSGLVPAWNAGRIPPGPYRVPAVRVESRAVATNTPPMGIYRGAGRPEAALLIERLVDEGARRLGIAAEEVRRRNLLRPEELPRPNGAGASPDSGNYPALLRQTLAAADLPARRAALARRRAAGECVGLGMAFYVEPCGQGWEAARITLQADGRFTLAFGGSTQGQGRETALAQIAAHALGCPVGDVAVLSGDTACTPEGIGALASRSTAIGGSAVLAAAEELMARARAIAAGPEGRAPCAVPGGRIDWARIAALAPGLSAEVRHAPAAEAWGAGCCIAQVAIDTATGRLVVEEMIYHDDAGVVVNPLLAEGQLHGGIAQGLGEALCEALRFDADGQLISGSLMDYALPRAADMPRRLATGRIATPSTANRLGARGVGEAGCIGAPPAVLNAAMDALRPFGVAHLDMPLTPHRIWQALAAARHDGAGAAAGHRTGEPS